MILADINCVQAHTFSQGLQTTQSNIVSKLVQESTCGPKETSTQMQPATSATMPCMYPGVPRQN
jgi:hypothetical protein